MNKRDKKDTIVIGTILGVGILLVVLTFVFIEPTEYKPEPPKITTYEVLNVNKYIKNNTNNFGAITSTETKYSFDILLPNGSIATIDNFSQEGDLFNVCITDNTTDLLIVKECFFDTYATLYLTKDTAKKIIIK